MVLSYNGTTSLCSYTSGSQAWVIFVYINDIRCIVKSYLLDNFIDWICCQIENREHIVFTQFLIFFFLFLTFLSASVLRNYSLYEVETCLVCCIDVPYCNLWIYWVGVNTIVKIWQLLSYCNFCIYTHPVNSKVTIWQMCGIDVILREHACMWMRLMHGN